MTIYEKNLLAIKDNDEKLYHAVSKRMTERHNMDVSLDIAKNGMSVLCADIDGKKIYLNSRYDPEKEAERFVEQYIDVPDYAHMIFFGLGNALIADKLVRQRGEHVIFLFYEPSADIFMLTLEHFDLTRILSCDRVTIVVQGLNDEDLDDVISSGIGLENYKICTYDVLPVYKRIFSTEEGRIQQKYRHYIFMIQTDISTIGRFGAAIVENDIYNLKELRRCNCEMEFKGVFPTDRPVIIVAAGPSLEKNVHYLKEAKGRFLIIAVDTALRYLISQGIHPDMAIMVDPRKPIELFEDDEVRDIPLAIYSGANHDIVKLIKSKIVFVSSIGSYYKKIFNLVGKDIEPRANGGSVATIAFVMAEAWGYRKIVLVGQDLALSKDKVHAGNQDIDTHKLQGDKIEIEGYYGDKVYTSWDYDFYRQWYENVIENDDELEVINATEGGAKIRGTVQMSLKEMIDNYDAAPFDFEKTIREMPYTFSGEQFKEVVGIWQKSVDELKKLRQNLYDGMRQARKAIDLIRSKQYKQSEIARIHRRVNQIIAECDEMDEIFYVDYMVSEEHGDILGDIYDANVDNAKEVCRIFEKMLQYMTALHSAVDDVQAMFERIIKETPEDNVIEESAYE